jgi:hypothetical protein
MSTRARKWLIFGIVVVVIAGAIGVMNYVKFLKYRVPDDAVLGNLDVAMIQIEPTVVLSTMTGQSTESTNLYIFRPDGGMSIASLDLDGSGGFYVPVPGSIYFIKDNKIYCCDIVDKNWKVTDRRTWQANEIFELRGTVPYISDNFKVNDTNYAFIQHETLTTWADLISQVNQKISEYQK